jgi:7-keto-8-aminopelargonate synthetase-like enzyme
MLGIESGYDLDSNLNSTKFKKKDLIVLDPLFHHSPAFVYGIASLSDLTQRIWYSKIE